MDVQGTPTASELLDLVVAINAKLKSVNNQNLKIFTDENSTREAILIASGGTALISILLNEMDVYFDKWENR